MTRKEHEAILAAELAIARDEAYLRGLSEGLGLTPEEYPTRVRWAVSHHGSDCSLDHDEKSLGKGYCRGVIVVRLDNTETGKSRMIAGGDFPESFTGPYFAMKRTSREFSITEDSFYGGGFYNRVDFPGIKGNYGEMNT